MNTVPTHLVINAAIEKKYGAKFNLVRAAFLWGSVAPDIPLILLSIGYMIYIRFFSSLTMGVGMDHAFNDLFFNNPWWIASHNFLHSPTMLILLTFLFWRTRDEQRSQWWLSFLAGSMIHSFVDILTHHDDGPLLFFPFDWHMRFFSPFSYWDHRHFASQVFWVELGINLVLLAYLFLPKLIARFKKIS